MPDDELTITLPRALADMVRAKVESGEYASESEMVRESLAALLGWDHDLERWLREEVVAAYQEMKADPTTGLTVEEVKASLAQAAEEWRKTRA